MTLKVTPENLLLLTVGILVTLPYWSLYQDMDDEAAGTALGAIRLLKGELPYRDWMTHHTPGGNFVTAAYYLLFGSGQWGTRSLMGLISSLTGLLIYHTSRQVDSSRLRYLPWLLWTCGNVMEKAGHSHHWFGVLGTAFTCYWLLRWALNPSDVGAPWWAGFAAALSSWFLQSNGLTSLLMVVLVWLRLRPAGLSRVILAYIATDLVLWLPWIGLAREVWQNHFADLSRHIYFNRLGYSWGYLEELRVIYANLDPVQQPVHFLAGWSHFVRVCLQYGCFYPAIAAALLLAERRGNRAQIALSYCCLAWALTAGYRQTIGYLAYVAPAFQLSTLCLLSRWKRVAAVWGGLETAGWFFRVGSISLAFCYPIATRAGIYWGPDPREAASLNQLHAWIETHCPKDSKVLAYPYFAREYSLEQLSNPIPEAFLLPWVFWDQEFANCAAVLDRERIPFILHRLIDRDAILVEFPNAPAREFHEDFARQEKRLFAHYQKIWAVPGFEVWARKPDP